MLRERVTCAQSEVLPGALAGGQREAGGPWLAEDSLSQLKGAREGDVKRRVKETECVSFHHQQHSRRVVQLLGSWLQRTTVCASAKEGEREMANHRD